MKEKKSSEVLYRKYRPQSFKEALGQEHITSVLQGAIKEGNIAHAYLFSGSRGIGKTTFARILAHEIGCSDKDLYEIDAASNRGIDDIRELRDAVHVLPFESPYKVYIIDEAHMLTKEAFNALLKTLEEPPAHAIFILATTEAHKVPETILSRCETHTFRQPNQKVLHDMALSVAKSEGYDLEPSAASLIATIGNGSFRDMLGTLQKVLSGAKKGAVSLEDVERITSAPTSALVNDFLNALADSSLPDALSVVEQAVAGNLDIKTFLSLILSKARAALLLKHGGTNEKGLGEHFSEDDVVFIVALSKSESMSLEALAVLLEAYNETPRSYIPQLPLELALMRLLGDIDNSK
ncbi:DNA polymerase III, subunit gamma and tau [Candidatus Kaiserbacteria bacterium CG10_big_fil_rev_8_21_14_0_10_49_17]|uniref:DNA polymerase III subunit gamma/tau n=1 Tax=Candidatus Kaiserbacteria bacterium CG10_big_fil_rev_8_21_14_0_10_49_17 TaxID=1974609 RepID=A0A2M6WFE3_9BACT|nr:MAG: DNA polymerase III, subunit gamma and tau [Candidatus Kaiserbacteria bacterium CG10_big_fil_rev_8_21_14_0_10_49_17]